MKQYVGFDSFKGADIDEKESQPPVIRKQDLSMCICCDEDISNKINRVSDICPFPNFPLISAFFCLHIYCIGMVL